MQQNQQDRLVRNLIYSAPFLGGAAGGVYELVKWLQLGHDAETAIERAVGGIAIGGAIGLVPRVLRHLARWYGEGFIGFTSRPRGMQRIEDAFRMLPLPYYIGIMLSGFFEYFRDSAPHVTKAYSRTLIERPLETFGLFMIPALTFLGVRYRDEIIQTSNTVGSWIGRVPGDIARGYVRINRELYNFVNDRISQLYGHRWGRIASIGSVAGANSAVGGIIYAAGRVTSIW